MAKEKKPLTTKQKQTKYRALQYTTFVGEFVSILLPFVVMGIVNAEEWFYQDEGWKVGLGGTLALALMGIAVLMIAKKKENESITNGYITLIVGWFAVAFIFLLLANILQQITTIMFFGGFGIMGAFGLDMTSKSFEKKANLYKDTIQKAKQEVLQKEVEKELLNKNDVKF